MHIRDYNAGDKADRSMKRTGVSPRFTGLRCTSTSCTGKCSASCKWLRILVGDRNSYMTIYSASYVDMTSFCQLCSVATCRME